MLYAPNGDADVPVSYEGSAAVGILAERNFGDRAGGTLRDS